MTVCEIFFKLKLSEFIQDIRTLESFGKFLLIVLYGIPVHDGQHWKGCLKDGIALPKFTHCVLATYCLHFAQMKTRTWHEMYTREAGPT